MEVMGAWQSHYNRFAYIDLGVGDGAAVKALAHDEAQRRGWTFERGAGEYTPVHHLLAGDWNDDFLAVEPGQAITMAYDDGVVACQSMRMESARSKPSTASICPPNGLSDCPLWCMLWVTS